MIVVYTLLQSLGSDITMNNYLTWFLVSVAFTLVSALLLFILFYLCFESFRSLSKQTFAFIGSIFNTKILHKSNKS